MTVWRLCLHVEIRESEWSTGRLCMGKFLEDWRWASLLAANVVQMPGQPVGGCPASRVPPVAPWPELAPTKPLAPHYRQTSPCRC